MGFVFDGRNRLEKLASTVSWTERSPNWQTLAKWIGVQVKTTEAGSYAYEDQNGFEYLIKLGATTAK